MIPNYTISFDELMMIHKWTKKYILELKNIENELCTCKLNIINVKWEKIIHWFNEYSMNIISNKDDKLNLDELVKDIRNIIKEYELKILSDENINKKIYEIFKELHIITTSEFIDVVDHLIKNKNDNIISSVQFIDEFGKNLYRVLLNSIFEIHEINIKCNRTDCPYSINKTDDESIKFLINDMYNINNFSYYKLKKFIEILGIETKNINFIADFKYMEDSELSHNLIEMLKSVKLSFKSLIIINANKHVKINLKADFSNNIQ